MATSKKVTFTKINKSGEIEEHVIEKKEKKKSLGIPTVYYDLGMYLALPLIIAVFAGQWLDRRFGTKAVFTIGLLIFGTISVFYNLYRLYKKDDSISNRTDK